MSYEELFQELKRMLARAGRQMVWFNRAERVNLLPALQAMRDKVARPGRRSDLAGPNPSQPTWEDVCRMLAISPDLVKKWKRRTQAETDIRYLLGEEPTKPKKSQEEQNRDAVKHLRLLVTEVLNGSEETADRLALALAERYGF
jgi:hypothetical protein